MKLVTSIDPDVVSGFCFRGRLARPGETVGAGELAGAVVLECAGSDGSGRRDSPYLYILWVWEEQAWREVARTWAQSWEWALELAPVARRILERGGGLRKVVSIASVVQRIRRELDGELAELPPQERRKVVGILHDEFAVRFSGEWKMAA